MTEKWESTKKLICIIFIYRLYELYAFIVNVINDMLNPV